MRVEYYDRDESGWRLTTLTRAEDILRFPAMGFEIALADIYAGTGVGG